MLALDCTGAALSIESPSWVHYNGRARVEAKRTLILGTFLVDSKEDHVPVPILNYVEATISLLNPVPFIRDILLSEKVEVPHIINLEHTFRMLANCDQNVTLGLQIINCATFFLVFQNEFVRVRLGLDGTLPGGELVSN